MLTQAELDDEVRFWLNQDREHNLFYALGFQREDLRAEAMGLHDAYAEAQARDDLGAGLAILVRDQAYKLAAKARLDAGEWLGWLWPLFVDHIRREGDYFLGKLQGEMLSDTDECTTWLTFMAEHAAFAAHLLDPSEAVRIQQAITMLGTLNELWKACSTSLNDQLLSLTTRSGQDLDAYVKNLGIGKPGGARSIGPPCRPTTPSR